jgi:hypothetical protein
MPQSTKKKTRRQLSLAFFGISVVAAVLSADQFSQARLKDGFGLLGLAGLAAVALLGFTIPTRCRVITDKGHPCTKEVGGFLFGCNSGDHHLAKFIARLGWQRERLKTDASLRNGPSRGRAVGVHPAQSEPQAFLITVPNSMGVCGFWFSLISTLAAVAGVIVGLVGLAR